MLFESTRLASGKVITKQKLQYPVRILEFLVGAGGLRKLGCFCAVFRDSAAAVRIRPHENPNFLQIENRQRISTLTVFLWARVDSNKLNYHNSLDAL